VLTDKDDVDGCRVAPVTEPPTWKDLRPTIYKKQSYFRPHFLKGILALLLETSKKQQRLFMSLSQFTLAHKLFLRVKKRICFLKDSLSIQRCYCSFELYSFRVPNYHGPMLWVLKYFLRKNWHGIFYENCKFMQKLDRNNVFVF
jgi:hypothetical protein